MRVREERELLFIRLVLFGPLLCSIGLAGVAVYRGSLQPELLAMLVLATAATWFLLSSLRGRGRRVGWLVSLSVFNLILLLPELALRASGLPDGSAAGEARAGLDLGGKQARWGPMFVRDSELFWKLNPGQEKFNSWGFRGPEVAIPKPEGVFRVVFLGDSCTQWGRPRPYPEIVQSRLNQPRAGSGSGRVESVSLAVAGYTSYQGLVVARKYGALVQPDLAVVCYGWNDHWLAYGRPDAEETLEKTGGADPLGRTLQSSRLLQLVRSALRKDEVKPRNPDLRQMIGSELLGVPRVSPEQYRENLLEIARVFKQSGTPVIFITAPSAHPALGTPSHFVDQHYAVDSDSVHDLHTQYVEIVREVARESGQRLLDLEREWEGLRPERLRELFLDDGIHFREAGCEFVAKRLADTIEHEFGRP